VSSSIVDDVKAVGHRIVHGGHLASSTVLNSEAKAELHRATMFAPLHNPANLKGVEACEAFFPGRSQVNISGYQICRMLQIQN
jgi:acetate kinase